MQMFLLGCGALLFLGVWNFALRKTILDHYRDKLFDLRDDLRSTYIEQGWDLGSPLYARLRRLANGYLRSTEVFSFLPLLLLEAKVLSSPALVGNMKSEFEQQFAVEDENLERFVLAYRERAVDIMRGYMVNGSLLVLLTFSMLVGVATVFTFLWSIQQGAFRWTRGAIARKVFPDDFVEEHSYRLAKQQRDSSGLGTAA